MRHPLIDRGAAHPIYVTQPSQPTKLQRLESVRGHFILSAATDPDTVEGSCFETLARVASHRRRRRQRCAGQTRRSENYPRVDQPAFGFVQASPPTRPANRAPFVRSIPSSLESLESLSSDPAEGERVASPAPRCARCRLCAGLQCIMHSAESQRSPFSLGPVLPGHYTRSMIPFPTTSSPLFHLPEALDSSANSPSQAVSVSVTVRSEHEYPIRPAGFDMDWTTCAYSRLTLPRPARLPRLASWDDSAPFKSLGSLVACRLSPVACCRGTAPKASKHHTLRARQTSG
ncbi:hypothetical protein QBC39DRAFT_362409 [Podospora conica]|nr:hypothetical protein QBC39DRAFT_362409 [Schizothecium conicum]